MCFCRYSYLRKHVLYKRYVHTPEQSLPKGHVYNDRWLLDFSISMLLDGQTIGFRNVDNLALRVEMYHNTEELFYSKDTPLRHSKDALTIWAKYLIKPPKLVGI